MIQDHIQSWPQATHNHDPRPHDRTTQYPNTILILIGKQQGSLKQFREFNGTKPTFEHPDRCNDLPGRSNEFSNNLNIQVRNDHERLSNVLGTFWFTNRCNGWERILTVVERPLLQLSWYIRASVSTYGLQLVHTGFSWYIRASVGTYGFRWYIRA
jgi:hypothetical protein